MKDTITQQLDDKEIKYANFLRKTGFGICAAKIIVALVPESKTQKELAICTDENQSAISIGLRKLVNANLVSVSEIMLQDGKGRPTREYTLKSWDTIVDIIEKETIQKHETETAQIERLKELVYR
jgi:predicted transcriptional regulator